MNNYTAMKRIKGGCEDAYVVCPVDVTLVQCQPLYVCITRNTAVLRGDRNKRVKKCNTLAQDQRINTYSTYLFRPC